MVLPESKNRVGLGRALMNSRGGSGGSRADRRTGLGRGRGRGKGPIEQVFKAEKKPEAEWYKVRSITEQNDLDEFLSTAELADTDFTAEKMNIQVLHKDQYNPYLLSAEDEKKVDERQKANKSQLTVPRRPAWDSSTTPEELDRLERESFLLWRRKLADLQETKDLLMTPFERNLEVWRQLWRVIERSDLVVQIVDARNPILFRCEDLDKYVLEVDPKKRNLLLVNKADLMTEKQRRAWADYFDSQGIKYRFFSAALAKQSNEEAEEEDYRSELGDSEDEDEGDGGVPVTESSLATDTEKLQLDEGDGEGAEEEDQRTRIITVDELEDIFMQHAPENNDSENPRKTTIGLVGYPNVGKSSTINALMGAKKVSVSATPGKTKHFQTLHLSDRIVLCDCPGLVFANFASTKAELVCNGILPIDQQREYTGPASLVARRIPQWYVEQLYGIKIETRPLEEGGSGIPTGEEMLVSYARARGMFKTGAGNPDDSRAARYVLKDYVKGRLLFCHPPPADPPIDPLEFNGELYNQSRLPENRRAVVASPSEDMMGQASELGSLDDMIPLEPPQGKKTQAMDKDFFARGKGGGAHFKNPFQRGVGMATPASDTGRVLSGRKAKTIIAIDNNLGADEVQQLMGSKKHFKGGKKEKKRLGMEM